MNTICLTLVTLLMLGLLQTDLLSFPIIKENKKLIIGSLIIFYIYHGYSTNFKVEDKSCGAWCQRVKLD
tara:strand:- start:62 stop:268 length:207 start_codon:yes stop_codon:yes gene_type:complete